MKIHLVLGTLAYGDGVGNDVMAMYSILINAGYATDIYALSIDSRIRCEDLHSIVSEPDFASDDLIIYHFSIGTELNDDFMKWRGKKIVVYHNITPPQWFEGYDNNLAGLCRYGLQQITALAKYIEHGIAVSDFNRQDLISLGCKCPIDVLPIMIPFREYGQLPDQDIIRKYQDECVNIIFVGRVAPNKRQEDVVRSFSEYQKNYNPRSRLFLVGAYAEESKYYREIQILIEELEVRNVVFTGHTSFSQLLAYYKVADLFLCMSEHEGFCIPLLEAMYFQIPIVAYASTAIPETLGESGILVNEKDYLKIAEITNQLLENAAYRKIIVDGQSNRLKDFEYDKLKKDFLEIVKAVKEN